MVISNQTGCIERLVCLPFIEIIKTWHLEDTICLPLPVCRAWAFVTGFFFFMFVLSYLVVSFHMPSLSLSLSSTHFGESSPTAVSTYHPIVSRDLFTHTEKNASDPIKSFSSLDNT